MNIMAKGVQVKWCAIGAGVLMSLPCHAGFVTVNNNGSTVDISSSSGTTSGATLVTSLTDNFVGLGGKIGATLVTYVYSGDQNNSLGGLTFVYELENTGVSSGLNKQDSLGRLTLNGFAGLSSVKVANNAGLYPAASSDLSSGGVLGFTWNTLIPPGGSSAIVNGDYDNIIVDTSATSWARNTGNLIDGDVAQNYILAPVPEPTTIVAGALLLLPFGASTLRGFRKNRTV